MSVEVLRDSLLPPVGFHKARLELSYDRIEPRHKSKSHVLRAEDFVLSGYLANKKKEIEEHRNITRKVSINSFDDAGQQTDSASPFREG